MQQIEPTVISSSLKRVDLPQPITIDGTQQEGKTGDVVAVEVTEAGGSYDTVERKGGEDKIIEVGDVLLGVLSYRKAVEGFVGVIPSRVGQGDQLHFIGGGGVIGECISYPEDVGEPFKVKFLGFVKRRSRQRPEKLNIRDYAVDWADHLEKIPPLIVIAGTRMDSGKTTLAANLIQELTNRGCSLGAAKLTGFTRQRDRLKMKRYGAAESLDFTDAGLTSTLFDVDSIKKAARGVLNHFDTSLDAIVVEMGGGVIGPDHVLEVTADSEIKKHTQALICTAMDPVAAYGLVKIFEEQDMRPKLISGPSTDTKTGKDEVEEHTGVKALNGRKDISEISDLVEKKIK